MNNVLFITKFDEEHRRAVEMLNHMRDKNEGIYRGGEAKASVTSARLVQNALSVTAPPSRAVELEN